MRRKINGRDIFFLISIGLAIMGVFLATFQLDQMITHSEIAGKNILDILLQLNGVLLCIPIIIYWSTAKPKPRKKLKTNNRQELTTFKKSAKNTFQIYVLNETGHTLIINRDSELDHEQWYIFRLKRGKTIYLSNGIILNITKENNLYFEDFRNQVISLTKNEFKENNVPDYVDWALIITDPNKEGSNKVYINQDRDEESIEPSEYLKTEFKIFIFNETSKSIVANGKVTIMPNDSFTFQLTDNLGISLNNGIEFFTGESVGLEVIDKQNQVAGLGPEWKEKLNVSESVDYAFSILEIGHGDQ